MKFKIEGIDGKVYKILNKKDQQLIYDMLKDSSRVEVKEEVNKLGFEYGVPKNLSKKLPYEMVKEGLTWEDIFVWLK